MLGQRRFGKIQTAVLVVIALVMGANLISPAVGHVTRRLNHLYKHLDKRYVKKGDTVANATNAANAANADKLDNVDSNDLMPGGTLPSGRTLRGDYVVDFRTAVAGDFDADAWSFVFTLPTAPVLHFIPAGSAPPAQCPGTSASPQAAPGRLCIYETERRGSPTVTPFRSGGTYAGGLADPWGAGVFVSCAASGVECLSVGTWAVSTGTATPRQRVDLGQPPKGAPSGPGPRF